MELAIRQHFVEVLLLVCAAVLGLVQGQELKARCEVQSHSGIGPVSGVIELKQPKNGNVSLWIKLKDLPAGSHGFHVHAKSSVEAKCNDSGPHLNIDNTPHGAPDDPKNQRHTGDLGNIVVPAGSGSLETTITDWLISLEGPNSVMGKAIVIHELIDDLGRGSAPTSNTTGNAGGRLGCCIIKKSGAPSVVISVTTLLFSGLAAFFFRATLSE